MKTIFTLLTVLLSFSGSAQFTIEGFWAPGEYADNRFPVIIAPDRDDVADRINTVLHLTMLEKLYDPMDENRFSEVAPKEGEISGATEFEYEVIANNENYLCLSISCMYTGAYSEYFTRHFVFDAHSGQQIVLPDLFSETALSDLSDWVNESIVGQIDEFLAGVDTLEEYGYEQYIMYTDCKDWMDGQLYGTSFYMTDSTIVFMKSRCSSHMMAALDDLWDFEEVYALEELESLMNDNGLALLAGEPMNFGGDGLATDKILEGTIGGKYPVMAILRHSYDNHYNGIYWYKKVKKQIDITGSMDEMATLHLTEEVNDKTTGQMDLMVMTDGSLDGTWTDAKGEKELTMQLKIAQ